MQNWQHYLFPKEFVIHGDYKALKHLSGLGIEFLEQFPYVIKHKQGKLNVVADVLLRRHALIAMLETKILGLAIACEGGILRWPNGSLWGTYEILNEHFFWLHMMKDVHNDYEKCLTCKLAKSKVSLHGLYTPLPIPTTSWIDISMNFVL
ncbi:hypothetical protein CR513_33494, partial [Mucuna pruriens]